MRTLLPALALVAAALALWLLRSGAQSPVLQGRVLRAVDGDTLVVRTEAGAVERARSPSRRTRSGRTSTPGSPALRRLLVAACGAPAEQARRLVRQPGGGLRRKSRPHPAGSGSGGLPSWAALRTPAPLPPSVDG